MSTADGAADAYLARPDDDRRYPAVLFMVDAPGLRPRIEEMADRIAARGYTVLAPNVFYRAARAPVLPAPDFSVSENRAGFMQAIAPLMQQLSTAAIARDGDAYLDYLAGVAGDGPAAITGYCLGGGLGWRIAAAHPDRVIALASFHGEGLVTEAPDSPHQSAGKLKAQCYFGHADHDRSMTSEQIAGLEQALNEAGVRYRSELHAAPGTGTRWPIRPRTTKRPPSGTSPSCSRYSTEASRRRSAPDAGTGACPRAGRRQTRLIDKRRVSRPRRRSESVPFIQ